MISIKKLYGTINCYSFLEMDGEKYAPNSNFVFMYRKI